MRKKPAKKKVSKSHSPKRKVVQKKAKKLAPKPSSGFRLQPFGDRVLVRPFTADEAKGSNTNHYGIILPDTVSKEKSAQGKVLAVGEGKFVDGKLEPLRVKVGDVIIFSKYGYDEVDYKDEELYLLKEENILAVVR